MKRGKLASLSLFELVNSLRMYFCETFQVFAGCRKLERRKKMYPFVYYYLVS